MDVHALAERLLPGARSETLTGPGNQNRVLRFWAADGSRILKVYGTSGRAARERAALEAIGRQPGIPMVLDRGVEDGYDWALFVDAGGWSLAGLPENTRLARRAGEVLRSAGEVELAEPSLTVDGAWIAADLASTLDRLESLGDRLRLDDAVLEVARRLPPPPTTAPRLAHTDPSPERFVVDHAGEVTLVSWDWATGVPREWDLSRAAWLIGLQSGADAAAAFMDGYGEAMALADFDRWVVYHAAMLVVHRSERRAPTASLDDLAYLVEELGRAVAGSSAVV